MVKDGIVKCDKYLEETIMSRTCDICGRGRGTGNQVSFSNKKMNRTFEINLQETTIEVDGKPTKVKACTKCIKKAKKA